MSALPECSAHNDCPRDAFLLLRDLPVCRVGFEELGGVM